MLVKKHLDKLFTPVCLSFSHSKGPFSHYTHRVVIGWRAKQVSYFVFHLQYKAIRFASPGPSSPLCSAVSGRSVTHKETRSLRDGRLAHNGRACRVAQVFLVKPGWCYSPPFFSRNHSRWFLTTTKWCDVVGGCVCVEMLLLPCLWRGLRIVKNFIPAERSEKERSIKQEHSLRNSFWGGLHHHHPPCLFHVTIQMCVVISGGCSW